MAKTTTKNKKPATRRKPTQLDRIEEQLKRMDSRIVNMRNAIITETNAIDETVDGIAADLSLLKSRASFMQDLDRAATQEEQGLEDGDYTDASKEVADALTAMGYGWPDRDKDRYQCRDIIWRVGYKYMRNCTANNPCTHRTNADFLSRARVTAKKLGLVPVDPAKIKAKEEEQKIARLKWATPVMTPKGEGLHLYYDDRDGLLWVAVKEQADCDWFQLSDITIID